MTDGGSNASDGGSNASDGSGTCSADSNPPSLVVPEAIRDALVDAARAGAPAEVCGVLGGRVDVDPRRVESTHPLDNVATEPRLRYELDPESLLVVLERIEATDEDVVGFYHSHPRGPSLPSETDVADATWPNRSYVIVSLEPTPHLTAWRWRTGTPPSHSADGEGGDHGETRDVVRSPHRNDGWFEREHVVIE